GLTALLDTPRLTVGEAGRRSDANACDPRTDQCRASAAATFWQQLGQPWGRPQGLSLRRLVLTWNPAGDVYS
ncbi:MAG: hypothetical protein QOF67_3306, partial [Mycobacterium sp.]|nr:hypothetical protein [Mycobacterium sp.]